MVEKHTCKSGLRIVLENIPDVRSVTIGIWVLAGSRNETNKNNGISHFLEHMFFKGTKYMNAREIAEAFDSVGGQVNAFTSKEYTCYYAKVIDTHKEFAIKTLSEMLFDSLFQEEELEKEKKVIYEEINMYEDTPDDIIHDMLDKASFGDHPLGYPILGTERQLNSFTKESLHEFINDHYLPENIVISVAGNVDVSFFQTIEKYFDRFETKNKRSSIEKPSFLTKTIKETKDTEQAHYCMGFNSLPLGHEDIYSLVILNNVFGGSMSSRLFQNVREEKGLAYSVFAYHSSFLDNGLLTIYAGTGKDQLTKLEDTIYETIDSLIQQGITDKELKNSKEQLKGNMLLSLESSNSRMSRNGKNELLLNSHRTIDEIVQEIDAVSHDSVRKMIDEIFASDHSKALIIPK